MFLLSAVVCAVISVAGVAISFGPDLPTGSVIVLTACCAYFSSVIFKQILSSK